MERPTVPIIYHIMNHYTPYINTELYERNMREPVDTDLLHNILKYIATPKAPFVGAAIHHFLNLICEWEIGLRGCIYRGISMQYVFPIIAWNSSRTHITISNEDKLADSLLMYVPLLNAVKYYSNKKLQLFRKLMLHAGLRVIHRKERDTVAISVLPVLYPEQVQYAGFVGASECSVPDLTQQMPLSAFADSAMFELPFIVECNPIRQYLIEVITACPRIVRRSTSYFYEVAIDLFCRGLLHLSRRYDALYTAAHGFLVANRAFTWQEAPSFENRLHHEILVKWMCSPILLRLIYSPGTVADFIKFLKQTLLQTPRLSTDPALGTHSTDCRSDCRRYHYVVPPTAFHELPYGQDILGILLMKNCVVQSNMWYALTANAPCLLRPCPLVRHSILTDGVYTCTVHPLRFDLRGEMCTLSRKFTTSYTAAGVKRVISAVSECTSKDYVYNIFKAFIISIRHKLGKSWRVEKVHVNTEEYTTENFVEHHTHPIQQLMIDEQLYNNIIYHLFVPKGVLSDGYRESLFMRAVFAANGLMPVETAKHDNCLCGCPKYFKLTKKMVVFKDLSELAGYSSQIPKAVFRPHTEKARRVNCVFGKDRYLQWRMNFRLSLKPDYAFSLRDDTYPDIRIATAVSFLSISDHTMPAMYIDHMLSALYAVASENAHGVPGTEIENRPFIGTWYDRKYFVANVRWKQREVEFFMVNPAVLMGINPVCAAIVTQLVHTPKAHLTIGEVEMFFRLARFEPAEDLRVNPFDEACKWYVFTHGDLHSAYTKPNSIPLDVWKLLLDAIHTPISPFFCGWVALFRTE
jgi:hypothetical protein